MYCIDGVSKSYGANGFALKDITLDFPDRGLYFILGKSGSGKTTLLNLMAGIDRADTGRILLDGNHIVSFCGDQADPMRNLSVGLIFQDFNLIPELTVAENVALPLSIQTWDGKTTDRVEERVQHALHLVDLDTFGPRKISKLSGGEIQRVAIARALVKDPRVILADEPTGNLDESNSKRVFDILKKISARCLVVVVTHDRESAEHYGDGLCELSDGQIVSSTICDPLPSSPVADSSDELLLPPRTQVDSRSMSPGEILRFAFANIRRRKGKLFVTGLSLFLAMLLLLLFSFAVNYDKYYVMDTYFRSADVSMVYPLYETTFTDSFRDEHISVVSSGQTLLTTLAPSDPLAIYKVFSKQEIYTDDGLSCSLLVGDTIPASFYLEGRCPSSANEIVITDFLSRWLGLGNDPVGKTVTLFPGDSMTIVGYLHTDYADQDYLSNPYRNSLAPHQEQAYTQQYAVAFVSNAWLEQKEASCTSIYGTGFDLFHSTRDNCYKYSRTVGTTNRLTENQLVAGRLPQNANEVVVSLDYAMEGGFVAEDNSIRSVLWEQTFSFPDPQSLYGSYGDNMTDLSSYLDGDIQIVGVYQGSGFSDISQPDIFIDNDAFLSLRNDYYDFLVFDHVAVDLTRYRLDQIMKLAKENQWLFDDDAISNINTFYHTVSYFSSIYLFVFCVLCFLVALMIYNAASSSIATNRKSIGVLRALGVTRRTTASIFAVEMALIFFGSLLLSTLGTWLCVWLINHLFKKSLVGAVFNIWYFNFPSLLLVSGICLLVAGISVYLPIRKFSSLAPILVIRDNLS